MCHVDVIQLYCFLLHEYEYDKFQYDMVDIDSRVTSMSKDRLHPFNQRPVIHTRTH